MTKKYPRVLIIGGPDVDARIELTRLLSNQNEVHVAGSNPELVEVFNQEGIVYYDYPLASKYNPFSYLTSLVALLIIIYKERPHIVHTFDTKPSILGRLAAKLNRVPVVIATITGLGSLYIIQDDLSTKLVRPIYEAFQKLLCKISDITFFYTHDDANYFLSRGIVKQQKLVVIPGSGVALDRFSVENFSDHTNDETRAALSIPDGHVVITMVARLVRSKGVLLFVDVARRVKNCFPNTHFLLIGSHDSDSLDSLSTGELDIVREATQWIGYQSNIEKYLAISDIFVLPANREGIPRVLMEAAAMNLPLIATDLPGCREVIIDKKNGFLFHPNDSHALEQAISDLVSHPEKRRQFGMVSRDLASDLFDLKKITMLINKTYHDLLLQKEVLNEVG